MTHSHSHSSQVPEGTPIYRGERGARYFIRNGKKVYINDSEYKRSKNFQARRGAFQRFIENQASTC